MKSNGFEKLQNTKEKKQTNYRKSLQKLKNKVL